MAEQEENRKSFILSKNPEGPRDVHVQHMGRWTSGGGSEKGAEVDPDGMAQSFGH